jgi:hypothetical protein
MKIQNVLHNLNRNGIMKLCYLNSFLKIFETDKNGDFKDDRIVLVIFGTVILLTGLVEGMTL